LSNCVKTHERKHNKLPLLLCLVYSLCSEYNVRRGKVNAGDLTSGRSCRGRSGRLDEDEVKSGQARLDEVKFYSRELMLDG
jgi:hypothetical protein